MGSLEIPPDKMWILPGGLFFGKGVVVIACNSINSTLEIFTLIMLGCLLIALFHERHGNKRDTIFIAVVCCHMVNTMGDLLAWRFAGKPGALAGTLAQLGNIFTYLFIPIVSISFLTLLFVYATRRRKPKSAVGRGIAWLIRIVSVTSIAILISNPWTGLLYRIDENNLFYWGKASSFLPDGAVLIQLVLFYLLLAVELRGEKPDRLWRTFLCCVIPTAAIIAEIAGPGSCCCTPAWRPHSCFYTSGGSRNWRNRFSGRSWNWKAAAQSSC